MSKNTSNLDANATDARITCENGCGVKIEGALLRLTCHEVSFELFSASEILQVSEVLANFNVVVRDKRLYSGRAVVSGLINTGPVMICQAHLQDAWLEEDIAGLALQPAQVSSAFSNLIRGWQQVYRILPEFKIVIADIQSFLFELRHWTEEIELGLAGTADGKRVDAEHALIDELVKPLTPCLNHLFENFELASGRIATELEAAHGLYVKRQLHPLLLCSPFMHRIYRKPLGYAGDYEMVNMILREPYEGRSLFAKMLNVWLLGQVPAEGHRNRVRFLTSRLVEAAARTQGRDRPFRVYNLGCGPAQELRDFMAQSHLSDRAEFMLLDFNDETLAYTRRSLEEARRCHHRASRLGLVKKSVAQVIKGGARNVAPQYDLAYCAGLFDYLPDPICKQVMGTLYDTLVPGGLLIATNIDPSNPLRNIMGYIFDWRLIERNGPQMLALMPRGASPDDCKVSSDPTGCNLFLEVRKPDSAS
jgi:extracellular factor (EF) 3-hydroxypalmitic acid methyl ester biosynthesis protein